MDQRTAEGHWEGVYRDRGADQVSWFQEVPQPSADLIREQTEQMDCGRRCSVIDVGGGAGPLATHLVREGFTDVTVLDVSAAALRVSRQAAVDALGRAADAIAWVHADLLRWRPERAWRVWHDRAVFHFLTDPADRAVYLDVLRAALPADGVIVLGTFAADGPTHCSGLPVVRYTPQALAAELTGVFGDALTVTGTRAHEHRTPAGAVQPFTWITARLR
ncbi:class I SAM-dependent methyltransferase [Actinocorallia sp. B10E7]|uniref:class I SAM-dependent methyltransferase n=1 Tax=Actinocorallia sp. B10E7 TaxID=3153558 RepID=UPI00325C814C